jgi:hypothetical protein
MNELKNQYLSLQAERTEILKELNSCTWSQPFRKLKAFHRLWGNLVGRVFVKHEMDKYAS